ncbi:uncharacterized protein [Eurosta solidaginis]|uniref:uncharacterized protein n=1 Tax=Eurosta solidaginis TaxID=178769 RepID=UPI003530986B
MKLFTIYLLLSILTAWTMAQDGEVTNSTTEQTTDVTTDGEVTVNSTTEQTTDVTTDGEVTNSTAEQTTDVTTDGPITVTLSSETSVDTTVGSTDTTTNSSTTAGSTGSTIETTTPSGNGSTASPPTAKPLQCYSCADDTCNEKVVIQCAANGTAPFLRDYRSVSRADQVNIKGYACYTIKVKVDEMQKDKLGCIAIPEGESACEAVRKELQLTTDDATDECKACQTNVCNSSAMTRISVVTFLCLMIAKFFI